MVLQDYLTAQLASNEVKGLDQKEGIVRLCILARLEDTITGLGAYISVLKTFLNLGESDPRLERVPNLLTQIKGEGDWIKTGVLIDNLLNLFANE